jgi:hypothetical protein
MDDLPPGFRFYPTEDELVSFYLHNKLEGKREDLNRVMSRVIPVVDIYEFNPWDLPRKNLLLSLFWMNDIYFNLLLISLLLLFLSLELTRVFWSAVLWRP